jgi:hypothetical protein
MASNKAAVLALPYSAAPPKVSAASGLLPLWLFQTSSDDHSVKSHHRNDADYNQVFHFFTSISLLPNPELLRAAPVCGRRSPDTDDPSDRTGSRVPHSWV